MLCQTCNQNPATVHVTEIDHSFTPADGSSKDSTSQGSTSQGGEPTPIAKVREQHLCDACAAQAKLPHLPAKGVAEIWKLLQASGQRAKRESGVACPDCGMSLMEFRQKGRLGCPKDYEVFGAQLRDLLERIHGSAHHVGRVPGIDEQQVQRLQRVSELQHALESAIRDEAYEAAARLRDELRTLQQP
jgi:protein arginine kinase activator